MSAKTEFQANKILTLDFVTNDAYLALLTDEDTEVVAASYERQVLVMSAPSAGQTQNTDVVVYPDPEESWGLVTHWAVMDAETSGNALYEGEFPIEKQINALDAPFTIGIGGIRIVEN